MGEDFPAKTYTSVQLLQLVIERLTKDTKTIGVATQLRQLQFMLHTTGVK